MPTQCGPSTSALVRGMWQHTPRNLIQETAISVQFVPAMRFLFVHLISGCTRLGLQDLVLDRFHNRNAGPPLAKSVLGVTSRDRD
eukprot:451323-Rhodomonas_salina.2